MADAHGYPPPSFFFLFPVLSGNQTPPPPSSRRKSLSAPTKTHISQRNTGIRDSRERLALSKLPARCCCRSDQMLHELYTTHRYTFAFTQREAYRVVPDIRLKTTRRFTATAVLAHSHTPRQDNMEAAASRLMLQRDTHTYPLRTSTCQLTAFGCHSTNKYVP